MEMNLDVESFELEDHDVESFGVTATGCCR